MTAAPQGPRLLDTLEGQEGRYPLAQLRRDEWTDLSGTWRLAFGDEDIGLDVR